MLKRSRIQSVLVEEPSQIATLFASGPRRSAHVPVARRHEAREVFALERLDRLPFELAKRLTEVEIVERGRPISTRFGNGHDRPRHLRAGVRARRRFDGQPRSAAVMTSSSLRLTARNTTFSSSRTLPGQW